MSGLKTRAQIIADWRASSRLRQNHINLMSHACVDESTSDVDWHLHLSVHPQDRLKALLCLRDLMEEKPELTANAYIDSDDFITGKNALYADPLRLTDETILDHGSCYRSEGKELTIQMFQAGPYAKTPETWQALIFNFWKKCAAQRLRIGHCLNVDANVSAIKLLITGQRGTGLTLSETRLYTPFLITVGHDRTSYAHEHDMNTSPFGGTHLRIETAHQHGVKTSQIVEVAERQRGHEMGRLSAYRRILANDLEKLDASVTTLAQKRAASYSRRASVPGLTIANIDSVESLLTFPSAYSLAAEAIEKILADACEHIDIRGQHDDGRGNTDSVTRLDASDIFLQLKNKLHHDVATQRNITRQFNRLLPKMRKERFECHYSYQAFVEEITKPLSMYGRASGPSIAEHVDFEFFQDSHLGERRRRDKVVKFLKELSLEQRDDMQKDTQNIIKKFTAPHCGNISLPHSIRRSRLHDFPELAKAISDIHDRVNLHIAAEPAIMARVSRQLPQAAELQRALDNISYSIGRLHTGSASGLDIMPALFVHTKEHAKATCLAASERSTWFSASRRLKNKMFAALNLELTGAVSLEEMRERFERWRAQSHVALNAHRTIFYKTGSIPESGEIERRLEVLLR